MPMPRRTITSLAILLAVAAAGSGATAQTTRPAGPPTSHPGAAPAPNEGAPTEREKIDRLIESIASLEGAVFIRNDEEHTAPEAAEHLRRKLDFAGDRIETAQQFIDRIASRSSTSGEAYRIRFGDGRETTSAEFLNAELKRIEAGPAAGEENPPAPGFDLEGSDEKAIEIADLVMKALGGREAWDETRYVTWRFFGVRRHVWDKHTGNVRIEYESFDTKKPVVILMNIHTKKGRAWTDGREMSESLAREMMPVGLGAWINDGYWMFMPYKLKDTGVTLRYKGEARLDDGREADVLSLTFKDVGRTPQNKYDVTVARDTHFVEQWAFYADASDEEPRFTTPWGNWTRYGQIMLSDDRGERGHTQIAVFDELPEEIFTSFDPVDWEALVSHAGENDEGGDREGRD